MNVHFGDVAIIFNELKLRAGCIGCGHVIQSHDRQQSDKALSEI